MLPIVLLLAQSAAPAPVAEGEKVFLSTCAVGYCHGVGGAANRGPRLRGRNFETGYVERTVRHGIPNSAIPAFETKLSERDLTAVVRYVESITAPAGLLRRRHLLPSAASHPAARHARRCSRRALAVSGCHPRKSLRRLPPGGSGRA